MAEKKSRPAGDSTEKKSVYGRRPALAGRVATEDVSPFVSPRRLVGAGEPAKSDPRALSGCGNCKGLAHHHRRLHSGGRNCSDSVRAGY